MPTTKSNLTLFSRRSGKVMTTLIGKRQNRRTDLDGNSIPVGINLNIVERVELLNLKETIETILEDCKDDGY